jgi:paired amphipathic helix protein Sin3a
VARLFHGHPSLISEFNTFLPYGYLITVMQDPKARNAHCIRVATPGGNVTDTTIVRSSPAPPVEDIQPALDYVQKIKTRFVDEPDRYRKFLDILSTRNDPVLVEKEVCVLLIIFSEIEQLTAWIVGRCYAPGSQTFIRCARPHERAVGVSW